MSEPQNLHEQGAPGPALTEAQPPVAEDAAEVHPAPSRVEPPARTGESEIADVLAHSQPADVVLDPEEFARFASNLDVIPQEQKQQVQELVQASNVPPEEMAKILAEQGVPEGKARKLLETVYGISDVEAGKITTSDELRTKYDANVQPGPEEFTPQEQEMRQAIEQEFGPAAERILVGDVEDKDAAIEELKAGFADRFGDGAKNVVGKILKYSTITSGIFVFLFILLVSIHTPNK